MSTSSNPPVPVDQAVQMTTDWRDYYGEATETDPDKAFRGFRIPLSDLEAMVDMARQDPSLKIDSVRAYLALGGEVPPGENIDPSSVHILLVPVCSNTPTGTDILEIVKDGKAQSTIMDFTRPCPAMCDTFSPLYGPTVKAEIKIDL